MAFGPKPRRNWLGRTGTPAGVIGKANWRSLKRKWRRPPNSSPLGIRSRHTLVAAGVPPAVELGILPSGDLRTPQPGGKMPPYTSGETTAATMWLPAPTIRVHTGTIARQLVSPNFDLNFSARSSAACRERIKAKVVDPLPLIKVAAAPFSRRNSWNRT